MKVKMRIADALREENAKMFWEQFFVGLLESVYLLAKIYPKDKVAYIYPDPAKAEPILTVVVIIVVLRREKIRRDWEDQGVN